MKLNYKLTFLIGFGFMASSIAWSVYNAYVPPILDEMLSASPNSGGHCGKNCRGLPHCSAARMLLARVLWAA